jgi:uncharacterized repeat protein (TIGR01451 family)
MLAGVVLADTDLAISQLDHVHPVPVGSNLTYTITVSNLGELLAEGVTMTDVLPLGATFVSASGTQGSCQFNNGLVQCSLGDVAGQSSAQIIVTVVPTIADTLTNVITVSTVTFDPALDNNTNTVFVQALQPPQITTQPVSRSVFEGATYEFTVAASGAAPLTLQWRRNGVDLAGKTNTSLLLTGITTNDAGDYSVRITNTVGAVTSANARLSVRLPTDPVYPTPQGGWVYRFAGNAAASSATAGLDGTWNRENSLDNWAGDTRGAGNGPIGGISVSNGVMTIEDAQTGGLGFNNRRFYFTHDLAQETTVTNAGTLLNDGVTLTFRARLTPPTDPLVELTNAPNGWVNNSDGKGIFGLRQSGSSGMIVGFSLNNAVEDTGTSTTYHFGQAGLHFNNLNGDTRSSFVDPGEGGTDSLLPLDPTIFHEFWITIQDNGGAPGTHRVSIYLDGATTPTNFNITAGIGGPDGPSANYLALGLGNATHRGAVDLDFFGYRPGVNAPAGFNQPPGITAAPQSQFVSLGGQATFAVGVTGTPPFSVQWYRDGTAITAGTNFAYTTPAVGTNDQFAAFTVVVSNDYGAVTSAPPALVLLLAPPLITAQPTSQTVTNGGVAVFTIAVNSATPPTYQWRRNGSPLANATNATLIISNVMPSNAGSFDVVVQNSSGSVTSAAVTLSVLLEDFGDAPGSNYATLKAQNGARHLVVPGVFLGASIDGELDGQSSFGANGDDLSGVDDENGIRFVSGPFVGQTTMIEVVASTNGVVSAWLDLNLDGNWSQPGEQVLTNVNVTGGTNFLQLALPATAAPGNSYARFRFSTAGGLPYDGAAADGEVEDYLVAVGGAADIGIHSVSAPEAVAFGSSLSYSIILTNAGPSSAGNLVLTNTIPAGTSFVEALPSQGNCSHSSGIVVCEMGFLPAGNECSVIITVQTAGSASLTNVAMVAAGEFDPVPANNVRTVVTTVADLPVITTQPASQTVTNGGSVTFTVVASGTGSLTYQWRLAGTNLPAATNPSLVLNNVTPAQAGTYSVRVSNVSGSVTSDGAILTVLSGPQIVSQPASRTNSAGSTAVFQVVVNGSAPLTYRWYFNGTTELVGQNTETLTLPSVQTNQAGAYSVTVSNVVATVSSSSATLTVVQTDFGDALGAGYPTLLTSNGARHAIVAGVRLGALIDFEADGLPDANALGDDANGADDEDGVILGATIRAGTTNAVSVVASINGYLQAWIDFDRNGSWTNAGEQVFTNTALVPGTNVLNYFVPPTAQAGTTALRFRFSTVTNLSFVGAAPDGEVEDYAGNLVAEADMAVARVAVPSVVAVGSNFVYAIIVTNAGPAVATGVILTNVLGTGVEFVSAQPGQGDCSLLSDRVICQLGSMPVAGSVQVDLTVVATQAGTPSHQTVVISSAVDPNAANNSLSTPVTVLEVPVITSQPSNQSVTNGGTAQFSVTASGTQLVYQWRLAGTNLPGATNATLTITNSQPKDAGSYTVEVGNPAGVELSAPATLTVLGPLVITAQPASQTVVRGANVTLSVGVTGTPPITYQWEFNGVDLPSGAVSPLVLTNIQSSQAGNYRVRITNPVGTIFSSNAIIIVNEPPTFTLHPVSSTNIVGTSITLTGQATGTAPLTYQWYFNRTNVLLAQTNTSLNLLNLQTNQTGDYRLVASNPGGSSTSLVAVVTVAEVDFGDAPESLGYPTTLQFNGARHRILPGIRLGSLIDREPDGQPTIGATGDNTVGLADEDGIIFVAPLLRGFSAPLQVIASTNGFIDAWIDLDMNRTWADSGEQILVSQPVVAGTNVLTVFIPSGALPGTTYGRFRFSTAGGLSSLGYAPDGEVEDYLVTIQQASDIAVTVVDAPDPVMMQSNIIYSITVTNFGPASASAVTLTNPLPGTVSFVELASTAGSCTHSGGVVRCSLGNFFSGSSAVITVTVRPNAAGTLSNVVNIYTPTAEGVLSNNQAVQTTRVFTPSTSFSNPAALSIADATGTGPGLASIYPSTITVSGLTGVVHKVTATLVGLSHTFADDLDVLLVSPGGQTAFLMSDVGGDTALSAVTLTFDDEADVTLPNVGTILTGSYRPTTFESGSDNFPPPAPVAPFGTALSTFSGINPNGVWSLFIIDDLDGDIGTLAGGWRLSISTANPMADLAAGMAIPAPAALGSNLVFNAFVTNRGPAAALSAFLTNPLPANVTFVSAIPSQGSCTFTGGVVQCGFGSIPPASIASVALSYLPQTTGTVVSAVGVSGVDVDFVPGNNNATASGQVRRSTDLAISQSTTTNLFLLGADVVYTVVMSNRGPAVATSVAGTDFLPAGTAFVSVGVTKGGCTPNGSQVDCTIGSLAVGEAAVMTLRVHPNSIGQITNSFISSLAEIDSQWTNNQSTNVSTVAVIADLGVLFTVTPNPVALSNVVTYTASITNRGPSTADAVVLTNDFPSTAAFVNATPSQGGCANVGGVVRCDLGSLGPQASALVTILLRAEATGNLQNTVGVSSAALDLAPANNTFTVSTTVELPPFIITSPASRVVTNGGSATFPVAAGGTPPLTYQWRRDGALITGATNTTLSLSNVAYAARGAYTVSVSNRVGFVVSPEAILTVLVRPTISDFQDLTLNEDEASTELPLLIVDVDHAPEQLEVLVESSNPALVSPTNVAITGTSSNRTVRVLPATNQNGTAIITLTVRDPNGLTAADTFLVSVLPINDSPVLSGVENGTVDEDGEFRVTVTVGDAENAPGELNLTAKADNLVLVPASGISVSPTGADRTIVITPATNEFGSAVIQLVLTDTNNVSVTNRFTLTVNAVNDAPTLAALADQLFAENGSLRTIPLLGISSGVSNEMDVLSMSAISSSPEIVPAPMINYVSPAAEGTLTLAPATNQSGTATITVTVNDGGATNATFSRQFKVTVLAVADRPMIRAITHSSGNVALTFATRLGFAYTVEWQEVLGSPTWTSLPAVAGTGGDVTVNDDAVPGPRFYRLRMQVE